MKKALFFISLNLFYIFMSGQNSSYYSSFDNKYDVAYQVEDLVPEEIRFYNEVTSEGLSQEDAILYINSARAQANLIEAPATIINILFEPELTESDGINDDAIGAVNIGIELINSTPKTIKEITFRFSFWNSYNNQVYDIKTGDKFSYLTFTNLPGRTKSTDYSDIVKTVGLCYNFLSYNKATDVKLFYNKKSSHIKLESVKIVYADGSTSSKVASFIGANSLLRQGPLSPLFKWIEHKKEHKRESQVPKQRKEEIFKSAEQMPQFPGGDAALMKYVNSHIQYPAAAKENNIQGRVIVQFVVDKNGNIGQAKVVRSVDRSLDNEALRVVKSLPKFIPGKQNGQPVSVWYTLPITFKLQTAN